MERSSKMNQNNHNCNENKFSNGGNANKKSQGHRKTDQTSINNPKQAMNGINLDYDYNTEYGDIPDIDK